MKGLKALGNIYGETEPTIGKISSDVSFMCQRLLWLISQYLKRMFLHMNLNIGQNIQFQIPFFYQIRIHFLVLFLMCV